jgi:ribosomal protein S18 acetylase RimI-like enzyme
MEIRRCEERDAPQVVELWCAMTAELAPADRSAADRPALERYFVEELKGERLASWIALERGRAIATASLIVYRIPPRGGFDLEASAINVITLPAHRRRGIATELLHAMIAHARTRPIRRIWLRTAKDARGLYSAIGFVGDDSFMRLELTAG